MAAPIDPRLVTTTALMGILPTLKRPTQFLIDTFFGSEINQDTEEVMFDEELHDEKLASFVAANVQGQIIEELGFKTHIFKPAYIKLKTPFLPEKSLKRAIGETIGGGQLKPIERQQLRVVATVALHQNRIARRREVMGAQALMEGKVTITGEKYPTYNVDFKRDPNLRITLVGDDRWGQPNAKPIRNIEDWSQRVFEASGAVVTHMVMGPDAYRDFVKDQDVKDALDIRRSLGDPTLQLGPATPVMDGAIWMGRIGQLDVWQYNGTYVDADDVRQRILPSRGVLLVSKHQYNGIRYHGAIMDEKAGLQAHSSFVKSWYEEDPAIRLCMTQCAPILVPGRVDSSCYATV